MLLSVVLVNWNSRDDLVACLESLRAQTHRELEVVVVDNGSEDGSAAMVRERFPEVTLIDAGENLGFAEGCNRGIAACTGPWVALLNNDAVADDDWAAELVAAAEAAPAACGMLQSLMVFYDRPDTINSTGIELLTNGRGRDRHEGRPRPEGERAAEPIFCPTGGAAAYRRTMLDAIRLPSGWLDRTYFCYFEDLDLGWRARLAGWDALYVPRSRVRHRYHASTSRRSRAWMVRVTRLNRMRTLAKNASPAMALRSLPTTLGALAELAWYGGLLDVPGALRSALAERDSVRAIARRERREVEAAWLARP